MKEDGWMISKMDMVKKHGRTDLDMKAIIKKGKNMDKAVIHGVMDLNM